MGYSVSDRRMFWQLSISIVCVSKQIYSEKGDLSPATFHILVEVQSVT